MRLARRPSQVAGSVAPSARRGLPRHSLWALLLLLVCFACVAVPYLVAERVILPSFARLERAEAETDVGRCIEAIDREIHHVTRMTNDWSMWDDTYEFIVDRNEAYIESNLDDLESISESLDIHLLYFCGPDGRVVWGGAYDRTTKGALDMGAGEGGLPPCLAPLPGRSGDVSGLVLSGQGPILVAALPITRSSGEGPARGTLIMGRFLDDAAVAALSRDVSVEFRIEPIAAGSGPSAPGGVSVEAVGPDVLQARATVRDVEGRPALLVRATVPRSIMAQGRIAARVTAISLFCSLAIFALSMVAVARARSAKLERLSRELEAAVAARTAELAESMERFRALTENSRDCIMRFDRDLRHLYVNPAIMAQTGMPPAEFLGKTHAELGFPPHLVEVWEQAMRSVFETGHPARIDFQLPSGLWLDWSLFPEFDGEGVVGLMTSARDITRRRRMEAELREREEAISTIYQTVQAGIVIIDAETQEILDANPAATEACGWSKAELVGRTCYAALCTLCDGPGQCPVAHRGWPVRNTETSIRRKGLSPLPVLKTVVPFHLNGRACLLESFVDIAALRGAREALEQSEARLRAIMEHMPIGIAIADRTGQFLFLNRSFIETFGYSILDTPSIAAWELRTGARIEDLFDWSDQALSDPGTHEHLPSGRASGAGRLAALCADGQTRHTVFRVASLGEDLIITSADVTARVEAEAELRKLSLVVEQSPVSVLVTDRQGVIQYVNPHLCRVTGYAREELIGHSPSVLSARAQPPQHYRDLWDTVLAGRIWEGELCNRRKDGTILWEHAWISPVFGPADGEVIHLVAVKEDITERRRVAQELAEAKESAEAASRSKTAFLASVSHEIRTPLNAVLGFAQLLHDDQTLVGRHRDYVGRILRAGEHLLTLINDVLEISRIEAGRVELHPESFDLNALLDDIVSLFQARASDKHLSLAVEYAGDVPRNVTTDKGRVRQILLNLVGNAVKFTHQGGIVVRVSAEPISETEVLLVLAVEDTGVGIAEQEMERLFRPFEQTSTGISSGEGTGLGLAISRSFARLLHGDLTASSLPGEGSCFRVAIPVTRAEQQPWSGRARARRPVGIVPGSPGQRVLVADDNALNRELLTTILGQLGFEIRAARDGEQALRIWEEWRPDAILMDIHMPHTDGCEATRRIRSQERDGTTKVIAISASALVEERESAFRAGCDAFIAKPISTEEALETLARQTGVRYLYEEKDGEEPSDECAKPATPEAMAESLAKLPRALLDELRRAVQEARIDRVSALAGEAHAHDAEVAERVRNLAAAYDYDGLFAVLGDSGSDG